MGVTTPLVHLHDVVSPPSDIFLDGAMLPCEPLQRPSPVEPEVADRTAGDAVVSAAANGVGQPFHAKRSLKEPYGVISGAQR